MNVLVLQSPIGRQLQSAKAEGCRPSSHANQEPADREAIPSGPWRRTCYRERREEIVDVCSNEVSPGLRNCNAKVNAVDVRKVARNVEEDGSLVKMTVMVEMDET